MNLNSKEEKETLKQSLKNTRDVEDTIKCLEYIIENGTPFALYIATLDRTNFTWIFDPELVYEMIGGESKYDKVFDSLFPSDEEREKCVIFFIMSKVGPFISVRVEIEMLREIVDELYDEIQFA